MSCARGQTGGAGGVSVPKKLKITTRTKQADTSRYLGVAVAGGVVIAVDELGALLVLATEQAYPFLPAVPKPLLANLRGNEERACVTGRAGRG